MQMTNNDDRRSLDVAGSASGSYVDAKRSRAEAGLQESRPEVRQLQGDNAKARRQHRSQLRTQAKKASSSTAMPMCVANSDPPPPICNRAGLAWGVPAQDACQCKELAEWIGKHKNDASLVRCPSTAQDCEGTTWSLDDKVSYWRPGGRHMKERYWYNCVAAALYSIRKADGVWATVAQVN